MWRNERVLPDTPPRLFDGAAQKLEMGFVHLPQQWQIMHYIVNNDEKCYPS